MVRRQLDDRVRRHRRHQTPAIFATTKVRDAEELVPEGELTLDQAAKRLSYAAVSRKEFAANTAVETKLREIAEVLGEAVASNPEDGWRNKGDVYTVVKGNKGVFDAALELGVTGTPPLLDRELKGVAKRYRLRGGSQRSVRCRSVPQRRGNPRRSRLSRIGAETMKTASDVMKERGLRSSCPSRVRMLGVLTLLRRRRPL